jgi:hypothetical protein
MLSRILRKEERKLVDVWREFGKFMFFEKSSAEGFEFIFDVLEGVFKAPAYYIYSVSASGEGLILESMRLRSERIDKLDEEVSESIKEPELKMVLRDEYKNFGYALIWAGEFINIPLYLSGKYIGNAFCGPYERESLDKEVVLWMKNFSEACAIALRQIKLGEEMRSKIRLLESRANVSKKMLGSTLEMNKFLNLLLELAITATGSDAGFIAMWDDKVKRMKLKASKNLSDDFINNLDLNPDTGLFEWVGEEMIVRDFDFLLKFKVNSIIAVPLAEEKKLLGNIFADKFQEIKTI